MTGQGLELGTLVEFAVLPATTHGQIPWLEYAGNSVASQVPRFETGRSERRHGTTLFKRHPLWYGLAGAWVQSGARAWAGLQEQGGTACPKAPSSALLLGQRAHVWDS